MRATKYGLSRSLPDPAIDCTATCILVFGYFLNAYLVYAYMLYVYAYVLCVCMYFRVYLYTHFTVKTKSSVLNRDRLLQGHEEAVLND